MTDGEPVADERGVEAHELVRARVRWKDRGASETDPAYETSSTLTPDDVFAELDDSLDADFLSAPRAR